MTAYSAEYLMLLNETIGKTPAEVFMIFEFPAIQENIINAAKQGKREYLFCAPEGMNFSGFFPGCIIRKNYRINGVRPSRIDTNVGYIVSWR